MPFSEDLAVRHQIESSGNIYGIVRSIQKDARQLADEYDNEILHSEAISCIVRGLEPDNKHIYKDEYEARVIRDLFCNLEDKELCDAIYDSFYESKKANNLVYVYNDIHTNGRKARVRILTRWLWNQLI